MQDVNESEHRNRTKKVASSQQTLCMSVEWILVATSHKKVLGFTSLYLRVLSVSPTLQNIHVRSAGKYEFSLSLNSRASHHLFSVCWCNNVTRFVTITIGTDLTRCVRVGSFRHNANRLRSKCFAHNLQFTQNAAAQ